ncbi:MAG TPA: acetyl-CoA carboxylase biotin carboxylase subunit [bacterium]|nr:acetyl-CoA carboxylase biotin carboxylase subunit [bacterium]
MSPKTIKKILIANRGEIAVRVIRACRDMGIKTVAVFSDPDRAALHVRRADEAYHLGAAAPKESYLNVEKLLDAAKKSGADAIHPGYGFLSENAGFAKAVKDAGLIFIGPDPDIITKMGSKIGARQIAEAAGVPVVPGIKHPLKDAEEALEIAKKIGFPVLLKAAAGGGGKGMRVVREEKDLKSAFAMAQNEAISSFKDDAVYIEKLIEGPHHIEVQVFGDQHGNVVHFFERECSVQRRHQKVIEESPSPFISPETRKGVCEMAVKLAKAVGYYNAGTIECLVDHQQNYYFLEMNTRLQVEHPITELVTGVDLVRLQIQVAQGEKLPMKQEDIEQRGHAVEVRVYAEDPFHNFMPAPGLVVDMQYPMGPGIRLDNGIYQGFQVPMDYDPILAKLIAYGADRQEAIQRMQRALSEYRVTGPKTNLYFHRRALEIQDFIDGRYDTHFIDKHMAEILKVPYEETKKALMAAALAKHLEEMKSRPNRGGAEADDASPWRVGGRKMGMRN